MYIHMVCTIGPAQMCNSERSQSQLAPVRLEPGAAAGPARAGSSQAQIQSSCRPGLWILKSDSNRIPVVTRLRHHTQLKIKFSTTQIDQVKLKSNGPPESLTQIKLKSNALRRGAQNTRLNLTYPTAV